MYGPSGGHQRHRFNQTRPASPIACLVFVTAVTELTATLVLAPIGVQTLATQFWAYQSEVAYGAAAPYALVIVALAMVPGALLGLWFDREGHMRANLGP